MSFPLFKKTFTLFFICSSLTFAATAPHLTTKKKSTPTVKKSVPTAKKTTTQKTVKKVTFDNTTFYTVSKGDSISLLEEKSHSDHSTWIYLYQQKKDHLTAGDILIFSKTFKHASTISKTIKSKLQTNKKIITASASDTALSLSKKYNVDLENILIIVQKNSRFLSLGDLIFITPLKKNTSTNSSITENHSTPISPSAQKKTSSKTTTATSQTELIAKYSALYNVNPNVIMAIIRVESGFNPSSRNGMNKGLMQISLPSARLYDTSISNDNIYDPETNIRIGTLYFKKLLNQFNNNMVYALAAYNAGSQNTLRWISKNPNLSISEIPFEATKQYVRSVLSFYHSYTQKGVFNDNN